MALRYSDELGQVTSELHVVEVDDDMKEWLERWGREQAAVCNLPLDLYGKFNVKRGLRNEDGSGVLVGLTGISSVVGYTITDNEFQPLDGQLRYRGIDIVELCDGFRAEGRHGYEEVAHLLLLGKLPNPRELSEFKDLLISRRPLPEGFFDHKILAFPTPDVMNGLARAMLSLYALDPKPDGISFKKVLRQSVELIAKFPTIIAAAFHVREHAFGGKPLHRPVPGGAELTHAENFLKMLRPDGNFTKLEADILDLCLVLHAEHGGGNNSTFTTHVVTSTGADTYSTMAAAIGSLKGPKHGGANASVAAMMADIKAHVKNWADDDEVYAYLKKIVAGEAHDRSGLVYGMGHAVYTLSDPRAIILRAKAEELAAAKGRAEELDLLKAVERLSPKAFEEIKGSKKKISANVDFYSGFVYDCLGIAQPLYTPLFAMARIAGWCAHRIEELLCGGRIIRPAYKAVAPPRRYESLDDRL